MVWLTKENTLLPYQNCDVPWLLGSEFASIQIHKILWMYPFCIAIEFPLAESAFDNTTSVPILPCGYITISPFCVWAKKEGLTRKDKIRWDESKSTHLHQGYFFGGGGGQHFGRCISKFLEVGKCIFPQNGDCFEIFEMYLPKTPQKSLLIAFLLTNFPKFWKKG